MKLKKWHVSTLNKERAAQIADQFGVPYFLAMLLEIRGIREEGEIRSFLEQDDVGFSDPMAFADMEAAAQRIHEAMENGERIAVYGDYDADGVTATAMLYSYLESIGADVCYYIPSREAEGYGMNQGAIEKLADDGVTLIITVDNGVSSVEEVAFAKTLGVDVVVTDHHRPREILPEAVAVVDPHRVDCPSPFKELSGVGVAFQLIAALEGDDGDREGLLENYADLVAIGTIGDIVSLTGENRLLVQAGLHYLSNSDRIGLRALMERAGVQGMLTASDVAFGIVPRINATGRMDSSQRAVELLLCEDVEEAEVLAEEVCRNNDFRKEVEQEILEKTAQLLKAEPDRLNDRVLVVEGEHWHHGVIGIVASRLLDQYGKPCIVISYGDGEAKGSGRSVEGFSLFDAIHQNGELFTKYGGHPMAAGFSMVEENIPRFRKAINAYAASLSEVPAQTIHLDCKLRPAGLSVEIPHQMQYLEPFGTDNPQPLFGLFQMRLEEITPVGGGKHLRLTFTKQGSHVTCMKFGMTLEQFPYQKGDVLDLAVQLSAKEFRGQEQLSIVIREMRVSGLDDLELLGDYDLFEKYKRREALTAEEKERLTPCREEFALVYRALHHYGGWDDHVLVLLKQLSGKITLCRLLVALQAMHQLRLIVCRKRGEAMQIALRETTGKVDLLQAPILQEIERLEKGGGQNA
ncbi:MAG: single-stranded-DNA-specific exonuclease RecJ [Oscillospiraceae bacterium]|nr:single-stranded-DNA-specific exonuclease RecJ [Oscillospiraceae bacterium]